MTIRPRLLAIAPAPVIEQADGTLILDVKFLEGMKEHCACWPGPVACLLRKGVSSIPFPATVSRDQLDFKVIVLGPDEAISAELLQEFDIISCSGDMHDELEIWRLIPDRQRTKLVYSIEYTLDTRLRILFLDQERNIIRKLSGTVWALRSERRRRKAFRQADGIQANGYPGYSDYAPFTSQSMLYLDNRMSAGLFATEAEMAARRDYLASGQPLRLFHSGRLEPMKGAHDLIPVAAMLKELNVPFTLDIYGGGSLWEPIANAIRHQGLQDHVRLHEPVDFATALVPLARSSADLFLSCHRQSDPSCTYVESMGCGLPVAGYRNRMWGALQETSGAGWSVPLGNVKALAQCIAGLHGNRQEITEKAGKALAFARNHAFEPEFRKRMDHLLAVAGRT